MEIYIAQSDQDILKCRQVMRELRPHIGEDQFLPVVREMISEGYILAFIEVEGRAVSVAGYRYLQFLHTGKHYYIDDLSTLPESRSKGYGKMLLNFVASEAKKRGFKAITLDSGHHRHDAHRLYLNQGFIISSHHFLKKISLE